ncbi:unnamed protein product [Paramecium sonneborni]|uniref:Transmembrane protein n=1 Tax=Paramecium sonneborni TaxID=65129 RepID=A0A8S1Q1U8_9CILI|nr:unnamed protein product [Paramecium sonneborni]
MENQQHNEFNQQYHIIPQEELNQQQLQIFQIRQKVHPCILCLLLLCGMSTLFGGYLLFIIVLNNNEQSQNCGTMIKTVKYYSQFLMIDGAAQIILVIILCFLMPIKKYDIKTQVDRQLSFEFFDQIIFYFVLIIMIGIPQNEIHCISNQSRTIILLYSFLIYILIMLLIIQKCFQ